MSDINKPRFNVSDAAPRDGARIAFGRAISSRIIIGALVLLAILLRAPFFTLSVIDWDESLYLIIAQRWLQGELPYVTVWDQHPVGLPALIASLNLFTPNLLLATRILACLTVAGVACLLFIWGQRFFRSRFAGVVAAVVYILLLSSMEGLPSNTELFNNLLIAGGATLLLHALRGPKRDGLAVAAAGLVFGAALQVKYTVAPEVVLLSCGYLVIRGIDGCRPATIASRLGILLLAGITPSALAIGYFAYHHALGIWIYSNLHANMTYITLVPRLPDLLHRVLHGLRPLIGSFAIAGAGLACLWWRRGIVADRLPLAWTLLWLLASGIDVVGPMKFWPHYFIMLVPPLSLLAGWAVAYSADLLGHGKSSWIRIAAAALLLAMPARSAMATFMTVRAMDDGPRAVADAILAQEPAPVSLYVYNYQPIIYYLANLRPPSRFVIPTELSEFSSSADSGGIEELARILTNRPSLIVVAQPTMAAMPASFDTAVTSALTDYDLLASFPDKAASVTVFVYRRKGSG
jgi:4-amino-4-deoxy-L-arabinose transferase-like glycosyltransferase